MARRLEDVFKTFLQDVLHLEDVLKTSSKDEDERRLQDVFIKIHVCWDKIKTSEKIQ